MDTASYVATRNYLDGGRLPSIEAVRTEEFVDYFDGGYEPAGSRTICAKMTPTSWLA